jgi:hypothetical protein
MATRIVHRLTVKLGSALGGWRASRRKRSVIAMPIIQAMIDVPIEVLRSVIPGPGAEKDSAREPLRAVIAIRSTVVRRRFVVAVWADGRPADGNPDTRRSTTGHEGDQTKSQNR